MHEFFLVKDSEKAGGGGREGKTDMREKQVFGIDDDPNLLVCLSPVFYSIALVQSKGASHDQIAAFPL